MILTLFILIILMNLFCMIVSKTSKVVLFLTILFLAVSMSGNTANPDYAGYLLYYDNPKIQNSFETGYKVLSYAFHAMGVNYNVFLLIIFLILLISLMMLAIRLKANPHVIFFLYMFFLVFWDMTQIRFFVMWVLYYASLYYYAKDRKGVSALFFVLSLLFQRSVVIFLFGLLLEKIIKNKRALIIYLTIIGIMCLITFGNGNKIPGIIQMADFLLKNYPSKLVHFSTVTRWGFLTVYAVQFLNCLLINICKKYLSDNKENLSSIQLSFVHVIEISNLVSFVALPLGMMNSNFTRYIRINIFGVYILIAMCYSTYRLSKNNISGFRIIGNHYISIGIFNCIVAAYVFLWIILKGDVQLVQSFFDTNMWL